jgi:O-succinylbenzoic acid--CoA ligase
MQDWLMARATISPHKVALYTPDDDTNPLTFVDLNKAVQAEAERLRGLGLRAGQHIAVATHNLQADVVGIFAVMRLGCVLVPINTRLTIEEVTFQCKQADASAILCYNKAEAQRYANMREYRLICPDDVGEPMTITPATVDLEATFAIIHTSGTSGKPKGAVLTYNNVYQSAMASAYHSGTMPDDNWLCVLPLFHVGGLSILLRSVLYGTAVTLLQRFDVDNINALLTQKPITLVSLVPTMLYRLLETRQKEWHEALRLILLGGAAPSAELIKQCVELGLPVATTYGLSEASSQVATSTPEQVQRKPASVGKPLLFTDIRIVSDEGDIVPTGAIGNIHVRSETVMQGYYRNMNATAQTLREGWLHTGDMGYIDDDGDLWIVQRRSDLIVSGGENVYPAEVEAILRQHHDVQEACVVGIDDAEWGQKVAVAIILKADSIADASRIQAFAREYLAGYKIPRIIRFVNALPQTASGKIQRPAVRELFA